MKKYLLIFIMTLILITSCNNNTEKEVLDNNSTEIKSYL